MLRDGFLRNSIDFHAPGWISVKFYGFPCFGMDFYAILWISMLRDGFLCNSMDLHASGVEFYAISWISSLRGGLLGSSIDFHASGWIPMSFYGFPCFGMDSFRILWVFMLRGGFQHFSIGFSLVRRSIQTGHRDLPGAATTPPLVVDVLRVSGNAVMQLLHTPETLRFRFGPQICLQKLFYIPNTVNEKPRHSGGTTAWV